MTKKITISENSNIVDMAIGQYGNAESLVQLCLENGLGLDEDLVPGNVMLIDGAIPYKTTGPISSPVQVPLKRALIVVEHQNIIDACLQEYGSVEQLVKLCQDNLLNMGDPMIVGSSLVVKPEAIGNKKLVNYLKKYGIVISSGTQDGLVGDFILMETGDPILMEDGTGILME